MIVQHCQHVIKGLNFETDSLAERGGSIRCEWIQLENRSTNLGREVRRTATVSSETQS